MEHLRRESDPTSLTTQQILREVANLDKFLSTRLDSMDKAVLVFKDDLTRVPTALDKSIGALKEVAFVKFEAIERQFIERDNRVTKITEDNNRAISVALDAIQHVSIERDNKFNLEIQKIYESIKGLQEVNVITNNGIQTQFEERDVRTNQSAIASKTAVDAALQAQKEAAGEQNRSLTLSINKSEEATQKQLEQQRNVLVSVEQTLSDKINDVANRMTRFEGQGIGKSSVSGPIWGVIGSIITGLLIAGIISAVNRPNTDNSADMTRLFTKIDNIERSLPNPPSSTKTIGGN